MYKYMSVGFCDNRCNVNYLYRLYRNNWLKHIRLDSEWQSNDYDYITDVNNVQNRTWHIEYTSNSRFNCNAKFVQKAILFN